MGRSRRTVGLEMAMGVTKAVTPVMTMTLNMLLPTMLPTARSGVPPMADIRLTKNSGAEVPMATMVRPIVICGMRMRSATPTAPLVSLSAPHITRAMPATAHKMAIASIIRVCFVSFSSRAPYPPEQGGG